MKGGQLVVIDSAQKQAILRSRLARKSLQALWIGFHDLFEEGSWTTVTDELVDELDYYPWAKGEPNNSGNIIWGRWQVCVRLRKQVVLTACPTI
ncbi:C-type lectin domain family 4 member M-like [Megalopta genalis]|uniref:C-type lectin domain family 4 member M-like n=1 Tax=Megalopta genalis TaxID=115081 RepID=UPI003FD624E7